MMKGILDNLFMNFSSTVLSIHECIMITNIDARGGKKISYGDEPDNYGIQPYLATFKNA